MILQDSSSLLAQDFIFMQRMGIFADEPSCWNSGQKKETFVAMRLVFSKPKRQQGHVVRAVFKTECCRTLPASAVNTIIFFTLYTLYSE